MFPSPATCKSWFSVIEPLIMRNEENNTLPQEFLHIRCVFVGFLCVIHLHVFISLHQENAGFHINNILSLGNTAVFILPNGGWFSWCFASLLLQACIQLLQQLLRHPGVRFEATVAQFQSFFAMKSNRNLSLNICKSWSETPVDIWPLNFSLRHLFSISRSIKLPSVGAL